MPSAADLAQDEEEFHSSFRIYLNAIELLAASPEEQSRMMGNYNVAWELREDVQNGQYLLGRGYLDETEEQWIAALAAALEPLKSLVLPSGPRVSANIQAMSHPAWEPRRFLAAEVLRRLSRAASRNAVVLGLGRG